MKIKLQYLATIIPLFFVYSFCYSQSEELTNASVISMLKKGLSESIIKAKIKQSVCNFDLSTDALISLKESKVSESLIMAMIDKADLQNAGNGQGYNPTTKNVNINYNTSLQSQTSKRKTDPDKVLNPKFQEEVNKVLPNLYESGIFIFDPKEKLYQKLDATVITSNKSGGFGQALAQAFTYGLANSKLEASIFGKNANFQIGNTNPVFYFYFDYQKSSLNNSNNSPDVNSDNYFGAIAGFAGKIGNPDNATALSPNDFKLIDLKEEKNKRSFKSGSGNLYSSKGGLSAKQMESFKYEKLTPTLYRVYFPEPLTPGEYCFYYAGNSSMQSSMFNFYQVNDMKVFDFGIITEKK